MGKFYSPSGNFEVWDTKPSGYYTEQEWAELHPPTPYVPSKEEKLAALDADYANQKQELVNQYTDDVLHNDIDAIETDKTAMTELDAWYDEEYAKLEGAE